MSTELVPAQAAVVGQVLAPERERDTVDGWIAMLEPVARLATEIAQTEFVPAGLRGKPAAITAAILYGREIGLGPIQSLQSVDVIDGRPAVSAEMARALALAAGHELYVEESTTARCVVRGRRANAREWVTITWTIDDAKRANLLGRRNWREHPRRMLQARATAELCHLLFADAIGGMPFTLEEIEDDTDAAGRVGADADAERPRTARRATRPASQPARSEAGAQATDRTTDAPPLPGDPGYEGEGGAAGEETAAEKITRAQTTKLHAALGNLGVSERARKLEVTAKLVGRELRSSQDLTKAEASTLIDTLEKIAAGPDPAARLQALVEQAQAGEGVGEGGEGGEGGEQMALANGASRIPPDPGDPEGTS